MVECEVKFAQHCECVCASVCSSFCLSVYQLDAFGLLLLIEFKINLYFTLRVAAQAELRCEIDQRNLTLLSHPRASSSPHPSRILLCNCRANLITIATPDTLLSYKQRYPLSYTLSLSLPLFVLL